MSIYLRSKPRAMGTAALAVAAALVLTSCGQGDSPSSSSVQSAPSSDSSGSATSGAGAGQSSEESPASGAATSTDTGNQNADLDAAKQAKIVAGWGSPPDVAYLPILIALDKMKEQGFSNITTQVLAGGTQEFQALADNQTQLTTDNVGNAAPANQVTGQLQAIGVLNWDNVVFTVAKGYEDCNSLNGKPVGVYDLDGGWSKLMKNYFASKCPDVKPNYIIIPDSALRAQAIVSGKIVGTTLALNDAELITQKHPDAGFTTIKFAETLPGVGASYVFTNKKTLDAYPKFFETLLVEQLKAAQWLYDNPDQVESTGKKYIPTLDPAIAKLYLDNKLWPVASDDALPAALVAKDYDALNLQGDPSSITTDAVMQAALTALKNDK